MTAGQSHWETTILEPKTLPQAEALAMSGQDLGSHDAKEKGAGCFQMFSVFSFAVRCSVQQMSWDTRETGSALGGAEKESFGNPLAIQESSAA